MTISRSVFWGTVFWGILTLLPFMLGCWQLQRLAWKTQLLANLETAYRADPAKVDLDYVALFPARVDDTVFIRGTLRGVLDDTFSFLIGPRSYNGQNGYHWYTLLRLRDSDGAVWVDRGFVPEGFSPVDSVKRSVVLTGLAYQTQWPGVMRDFSGNLFQRMPVPKDVSISPLVFCSETLITTDTRVMPDVARPVFRNDHFSYAVFWFVMAWIAATVAIAQAVLAHQKS